MARRRPLQTWKSFLRNHVEEIASIDLFIVPTIAFRQLFVFLVLGHRRRQLLWFAVTQNPTAEWLARQITEAFPWDTAPKYLIRGNDRAFGGTFKARVRAMGIRDRPTSFRSPWQNGYVERLIGSARRECTDHLIAFNTEHLRQILAKYAIYYIKNARPATIEPNEKGVVGPTHRRRAVRLLQIAAAAGSRNPGIAARF